MKSYAIADFDSLDDDVVKKRITRLVNAGVDFVQIRNKGAADGLLLERSRDAIRARNSQSRTRFIVNGRADVAAAAEADGVHLTSRGIPVQAARRAADSLLVGRSCHSLADVERAVVEQADYVLLGPRFTPRSKAGTSSITDADIDLAVAAGIPVFVLGGICPENLKQFAGRGIAGLAGITLFMMDEPLELIVESVRKL